MKNLYYDFFQKLCKLGPAPFFMKFPLIFPLETIQFSIPDKSTLDNARIKNLGLFFWYIQDETFDSRGLWITAFVSPQIKIVHSYHWKSSKIHGFLGNNHVFLMLWGYFSTILLVRLFNLLFGRILEDFDWPDQTELEISGIKCKKPVLSGNAILAIWWLAIW